MPAGSAVTPLPFTLRVRLAQSVSVKSWFGVVKLAVLDGSMQSLNLVLDERVSVIFTRNS